MCCALQFANKILAKNQLVSLFFLIASGQISSKENKRKVLEESKRDSTAGRIWLPFCFSVFIDLLDVAYLECSGTWSSNNLHMQCLCKASFQTGFSTAVLLSSVRVWSKRTLFSLDVFESSIYPVIRWSLIYAFYVVSHSFIYADQFYFLGIYRVYLLEFVLFVYHWELTQTSASGFGE